MTLPCSCIDGRATDDIFGSPGGDAGIVTRALVALNLVFGIEITPELVKKALGAASHALRRPLYLHTDSHAMEHFDPSKPGSSEADCIDPKNIGCGYLKLSTTSPETLEPEHADLLRDIAQKVIIALCKMMWADRSFVELVNLIGDHREDAVYVSDSMTDRINPHGHAFVYHPKKEEADCRAVALALSQLVGKASDADEVVKTLNQINERHWVATINVLAPGVEHQRV